MKAASGFNGLWAAVSSVIVLNLMKNGIRMQKITILVMKPWQMIAFQIVMFSFIGMLFLSGCHSEPAVIVGEVEIVVTFGGDVVTECDVNLAGIGRAEGATAKLSESGTVLIKDVRIGKYKVYISPPQLEAPLPDIVKGGYKSAPVPDDVPVLFHSEITSPITIEVKEGFNSFAFDLKKLKADS